MLGINKILLVFMANRLLANLHKLTTIASYYLQVRSRLMVMCQQPRKMCGTQVCYLQELLKYLQSLTGSQLGLFVKDLST